MNIDQKGFANIALIVLVVILAGVAGYFALNNRSTTPTPVPPIDGQPTSPSSTPTPSPSPTPQSTTFNLIFKYGVGAKNELNTFTQTYTKDMVMDPSVTIKLKLTDNELAGIYQKLNDLKLFSESTKPVEGNVMVTPCSSYYLKVQINSKQKELSWNNCRGRISDKFQQFTSYLIQIIESKEEYKKLPEPQGGYL